MSEVACAIKDCGRVKGWHQWCKTHGRRWRLYGDPLGHGRVNGVDYNVKADCQVSGCGRKAHAHKFCTKHLARWEKYGDPMNEGTHNGRPLKGQFPTFAAIHKRLSRKRGSAKNYACVDCGETAAEWSYIGGCPNELMGRARESIVPYSEDLGRYEPRCVRCHRVFDRAGEGRERDASGRFAPAVTEVE